MFTVHKIKSWQTPGEILKEKRRQIGLDLEEVSRRVCISPKYLEAIEEDRYEDIPGEIYLRNFLKVYAKFLNLDVEEIFKIYQIHISRSQSLPLDFTYKKTDEGADEKIRLVKSSHQWISSRIKSRVVVTPDIFKKAFLIGVIVLVLVYLGWQTSSIISKPDLIVISPPQDYITQERTIKVMGWTDKEVRVMINDQLVNQLDNSSGSFEEVISLRPGLNVIKITAKKIHGREHTVYRKVMVVEKVSERK